MFRPRIILLSMAVSLFFCSALTSSSLSVPGLGKVVLTSSGNRHIVNLGKLGTFSLRGSLKPLKLEGGVRIEQLSGMPGYAALSRMGLESIRLSLSDEGLALAADINTRRSLKTLCSFLRITTPRIGVTAKITSGGLELEGGLSFAARPIDIRLIPLLGTRFIVETVTLQINAGVERKAADNTGRDAAPATSVKKKLSLIPELGVRLGMRIQPTKWDPRLKTELQLSYNLVSREMSAAGSLTDTWKNPLGLSRIFKNSTVLEISDAAVQIGWIPGTPTPTKIGFFFKKVNFMGISMGGALDLSPASGKAAFLIQCDKFGFSDLVKMIRKGLCLRLPDLGSGDISLKDVKILFSPNGGEVGAFKIEKGLALRGRMNLGSAFSSSLDFRAGASGDVALNFLMKARIREAVGRSLRRHKHLQMVIKQLLHTLEVRRIALNLKATGNALAGGMSFHLRLLGRDLRFRARGSLNPREILGTIVGRVKVFAEARVMAMKKAITRGAARAGKKAGAVAAKAWDEALKTARSAATAMNHSRHTFAICYNKCVPRYAGKQSRRLQRGSDRAVDTFARELMPQLKGIEGDTPDETAALRRALILSAWKELLDGIDARWKKMLADREVVKFFFRPAAAGKGRRKYKALVRALYDRHKQHRNRVLHKMLLGRQP